ncbi:MAG: AmmeMemoRadiSam system protein B [Halieaceae bacterium]|jgi:MEMO1 family protein|nr:AmmeMemoRadiSam system protein B [Halieaceae bacterium]
MSQLRSTAVAGLFYAADAAQLRGDVDALLAQVDGGGACPKVVIAPHAGYQYSGLVAAQVYGRVTQAAGTITRVVLLGPSHRVGFVGIAASTKDYFATPLGNVRVDREALGLIDALPQVHYRDRAHLEEHSLEVHLPFLQRCLQSFSLVPLVVGHASPTDVAEVLECLWGGPETLIVVSSDLSHFLPYGAAQARDEQTSRRIESLASDISGEEACGAHPLNGLLCLASRRGLKIERVALKNSGDATGDRNRVVGYGSYVIYEPVQP